MKAGVRTDSLWIRCPVWSGTGSCCWLRWRDLGVAAHVMQLPGAELEGFEEALDFLLKKTVKVRLLF